MAKPVHHVIYVLGLGDQRTYMQQLVPHYWGLFGVTGHCYLMHWNDKQPFASKFAGLMAKIDELAADGNLVSLVGTSAGASVVLNAYALRVDKIAGVVCICGKINHSETIKPRRFIENPAFKESLSELQKTLPKLSPQARARIMSFHPLRDDSVPVADTLIPGAVEATIPTIGHAFSIACTLIFKSAYILRFLKRQAERAKS